MQCAPSVALFLCLKEDVRNGRQDQKNATAVPLTKTAFTLVLLWMWTVKYGIHFAKQKLDYLRLTSHGVQIFSSI